jgi:formamidopyrimidine-DNA glycosylase
MPELPDLTLYREALAQRIVGQHLDNALILLPFLLRMVEPPLTSAQGRRVTEVRRIGKRLAIGLEGELWLVFHLMIAGRLHWFDAGTPLARRAALARVQFGSGTLTLTDFDGNGVCRAVAQRESHAQARPDGSETVQRVSRVSVIPRKMARSLSVAPSTSPARIRALKARCRSRFGFSPGPS